MPNRLAMLACAICASLFLSGCATMFSGSKEEVRINSNPEGATVIVFGGQLGSLIRYGAKTSELMKFVASHLPATYLSEADRRLLETYDFESIITAIVLEIRGNRSTDTSVSKGAAEILAKIPRPIKEKLLDQLGLEEFAVAPVKTELSRGTGYAVIGWKTGRKASIATIDGTFNSATLLNVFNLGLGVFVDAYTGAWLKLSPTHVNLDLTREAPRFNVGLGLENR